MSKILLAMMAFLLLIGQVGLADAFACQANDLVQTVNVDDADPCLDDVQTVKLVKIYSCDCGSLIWPTDILETAVFPLPQLSFETILWPQTAVTELSTPPPRLI